MSVIAEIEARLAADAGQRVKGRLFEGNEKPAMKAQQPLEEPVQRQPARKEVAAGCNCGQFLFGRFSDGKNPSSGSFSEKACAIGNWIKPVKPVSMMPSNSNPGGG